MATRVVLPWNISYINHDKKIIDETKTFVLNLYIYIYISLIISLGVELAWFSTKNSKPNSYAYQVVFMQKERDIETFID